MPRGLLIGVFFVVLVAAISLAGSAFGIRAALDYTFFVSDRTGSKTITCDNCSYLFREHGIALHPLRVDSRLGHVVVFFRHNAEQGWPKDIFQQSPLSSGLEVFETGLNRATMVREGQTVVLRGRGLSFKLIDASGTGCPEGAKC